MPTQQSFSSAMKYYESALDASLRAENGVFYTDIALAELIIESLRMPKNATVFDPCCGMGSFLYAASKKGYLNIFGADCDSKAVSLCAEYVPTAILETTDTIGNVAFYVDQFDFVIGNPPYAPIGNGVEIKGDSTFKGKVLAFGRNLFVAALIRSFEYARLDGGVVSYIIPKNFLHVSTYSEFRKVILRDKTIVSIVDLGVCFKDVRGEQIVLTVKNSFPNGNSKIDFYKYTNSQFIAMPYSVPQSFYTDEILLFTCKNDYEVYTRLSSTYKTLDDLKGGYVGRGKSVSTYAVSGKDIRKFGYKATHLPSDGSQIFIQNIYSAESGIIAAFGGNLEATQTVTIFTDGNMKMCRYILGILHSRLANFFLYKYCYNSSHLTMHTDAKYLNKIPLPTNNDDLFNEILSVVTLLESDDYLSEKWFTSLELLNAVVYRAYGIESELANYIDNEMKATQSKKWRTK